MRAASKESSLICLGRIGTAEDVALDGALCASGATPFHSSLVQDIVL